MLDAAAAAGSLVDFLTATLAALDEHLGYPQSAFMLTLAEPPLPGSRAYAGATHGQPPYVLEEYFERWADSDPLGSRAAGECFLRNGRATTGGIYHALDSPRRRFVDDFLCRIRTPHELSYRLPIGATDAYLTLQSAADYFDWDERVLEELAPALQELLRSRLPRGVDGGLSLRETQVVELVTLGFSNREIAGVLHVEEDTVKKHVSRALARLGVERRTSLAVAWATGRRIDLPPTIKST